MVHESGEKKKSLWGRKGVGTGKRVKMGTMFLKLTICKEHAIQHSITSISKEQT